MRRLGFARLCQHFFENNRYPWAFENNSSILCKFFRILVTSIMHLLCMNVSKHHLHHTCQ